jgi:hypothetical protein
MTLCRGVCSHMICFDVAQSVVLIPAQRPRLTKTMFLPWTDLPMEYNAVRLGNLDDVDLRNLVSLS